MKRWLLEAKGAVVLAPLVCFGLAFLVDQTAWFRQLAWQTLDVRTRVRARLAQPPPDERVAVIGIGNASIENISQWPFPRRWHGQLQALLQHASPKVLAWDVLFPDRVDANRQKIAPQDDLDLAISTQVLDAAGVAVVFGAASSPDPTGDAWRADDRTRPIPRIEGDIARLSGDPYVLLPFPELRTHARFGLVDAPERAAGVVRELPLVVRAGDQVFPSLALQAVLSYWDVPVEAVRVALGDAIYFPVHGREKRVPISAAGLYLINYRYEKMENDADLGREFLSLEYHNLLIDLHQRYPVRAREARPPPDLRGKIVLIGEFSTDVGTSPRSPISPLVLVHANAIDNILNDDYVRRAPTGWVWAGALLLGYLGVALSVRTSVSLLIVNGAATLALYCAGCFGAWIVASVWVPLLAPSLGYVSLQFVVVTRRILVEQRARQQLKTMFGSYLSPRLLDKMLAENRLATIGGDRRAVTILFADLRDFTAWSERTRQDVLIAQLNEYLTAMAETVHEFGGTLHKFIGDAVMAVWGDVESGGVAEDARQAARAALRMLERLEELNRTWAARGLETFRMGVGLNHGTVTVGNVGSPHRMEFTVIGDAVNLASRLESMNKELGTTVLVGENLHSALSATFRLAPKGSVRVRGKVQATSVYELFPLKGVADSDGKKVAKST